MTITKFKRITLDARETRSLDTIGILISEAKEVTKNELSPYCIVEDVIKLELHSHSISTFDIWFTLHFDEDRYRLLKIKQPALYDVIEDTIGGSDDSE